MSLRQARRRDEWLLPDDLPDEMERPGIRMQGQDAKVDGGRAPQLRQRLGERRQIRVGGIEIADEKKRPVLDVITREQPLPQLQRPGDLRSTRERDVPGSPDELRAGGQRLGPALRRNVVAQQRSQLRAVRARRKQLVRAVGEHDQAHRCVRVREGSE